MKERRVPSSSDAFINSVPWMRWIKYSGTQLQVIGDSTEDDVITATMQGAPAYPSSCLLSPQASP
eukprot:2826153-Prorocentrum_lima.AAC.1